MAVEKIEMACTDEGLESIATMIAEGTVFTIGYFRITTLGDPDFFESKKVYRAVDPDAYYMSYSADDFDTDHGLGTINSDLVSIGISDAEGYIAVNTVELADSLTVEINCYIPPTPGITFDTNEIMVYTGSGTLADPWRSFVWGIFPTITKIDKYGINFRVLVQL